MGWWSGSNGSVAASFWKLVKEKNLALIIFPICTSTKINHECNIS
jgi:hypothetical protein